MKRIKSIYILMVLLLWNIGGVNAQIQRLLTGTVNEMLGDVKEPLIEVNINITNSQNRSLGGAVTDISGNYRVMIPVSDDQLTIVFSYIGMKSQSVKYTGQKTISITMESDSRLEEVLITAHAIDRNDMGISLREQTSATQKVDMKELVATTPLVTVDEILQGQLAGVDIIAGGDPGARSSIRIRGTSTLNASSDPLIVIDGVPYPTEISDDFDFGTANEEDLGALLNISPNDIESVEVLKDAAATAIWGTQGANGVLIITTKKGKIGKTNFSFSSKFTSKVEPKTIPMLNGDQYTAMIQDAIWNSANYIGMEQISNKYLELLFDMPEIGYDQNWKYFNEYNQNTDWLSLIQQTANTWDNSFSMSGGGEKATYRLSSGYMRDDGTTIGTSLKRINTSIVISYKFSNKLTFGADYSFSNTTKDANWTTTVRSEAFKKMPNKSPYTIDSETGKATSDYFTYQTDDYEGTFGGKNNYNPVAMAKEAKNNTLQRENNITVRGTYKIIPDLTYFGWVSLKMRNTKTTKFLPQNATGVVWTNKYANLSSDAYSDKLPFQTENKLNYMKNWEDNHRLIGNVIFRTSQGLSSSYTSETSGNASSDLSDPILGTTVNSIKSSESESRSASGIVAANYMFLDRYVINGTINMEGNSAMGKEYRIGYFPSVGIAYHIQNEPFMSNIKESWLDEFKIRFSVGESGRGPSGSSVYLGAFSSNGEYMNMSAISPIRIQLNNLKWETSTEYNWGADIAMFKDRLKFNFEYYKKYARDLLQKDFTIPSTTGYREINYFNSGEMTNKGWEFRTDIVLLQNKGWNIKTYVNFARNINEITSLPDNMTEENYSFENGEYAFRVFENQPIGAFYGYRYLGVYQNKDATYARDSEGTIMNDINGNPIIMKNGTVTCYPGDAIYEDINFDGVINEYDIVYLGNSMPTVTGGTGLMVRYKRFAMNAFFHFRVGQSIINSSRMSNESMYRTSNQSTAVLRRWRNEGDDTDIPRALYNEGYNWLGSNRFVEDASFLRLKTLSLNYSFPRKVCDYFGISVLNVFATGYNLFTWTNYAGQDPEVNIPSKPTSLAKDNATTPVATRFAFGINMNF